MDPITLAIVSALIAAGGSFAGKAFEEAGKAVGSKIGGAVGDKAAQLFARIGKKADDKKYPIAQAALQEIIVDPKNVDNQQVLALGVKKLTDDDEGLKNELLALAQEINDALKPASSGNTVTVGNIHGNKDSNINVSGGDINIGQLSRRDDS